MPSEPSARRLHPASIFFNLLREVKTFALPGLLILFGSRDRDAMFTIVSAALAGTIVLAIAIVRYFSFTYTYQDDELVVRSGLFFKRERHIPYSRIQNIDATQNVVHALFGVYTVALETGGGAEAEATLSVLPADALAEMRRRVFDERREAIEAPADGEAPAVPAPAQDVLLRLSVRDLALCGLVRGRGLLLLGAIASVLFDIVPDRRIDDAVEETAKNPESRGRFVEALRGAADGLSFDIAQLLAAVVLLIVLVGILRVFSMLYTMQRLYGFTLVLAGGELRMAYGSLTRVRATIPVRRIQTLTVREGPLHRLFGVCSVRADTAGGEANPETAGSREWLAPILDKAQLAGFLRTLMPEVDIETVTWQPAHPRALRRALVKPLVLTAIASIALAGYAGAWAIAPAMLLAFASVAHARRHVKHLGHALEDNLFMFKSGVFWRHATLAPVRKVQAVSVRETPFDRRHGMAGLTVDTAGADGAPHRLAVPYLARDRAGSLSASIAGSAAQSSLSW
ncbi:MAG: PH domain-containing protein [Vicinamibacterales bacterium]